MYPVYHSALFHSALVLAVSVSTVAAQDDRIPGQPKAQVQLTLQLVRTDGNDIFEVFDVPDPTAKPSAEDYTVKVPVQKTVVRDGKPVVETSYIEERRTRMVRPLIRKSIPLFPNLEFRDQDGKPIPKDRVIGKLGMGSGKYVVKVPPKFQFTPDLRKLFAPDSLFLHFKDPDKN